MAGSIISMPANKAIDWSNFTTIAQHSYRGFDFISLTNTTNDSEPEVEDGSYSVVNGAMYKLTPSGSDESITGWAGIGNNTQAFIKVVPAGLTCTIAFTDTVPTWSASKGGWYDSNDKYIAEIYRGDSVAVFGEKNIIRWRSGELATRIIRTNDWDMNVSVGGSGNITIEHNLTVGNIRTLRGYVRGDVGSGNEDVLYPIDFQTGADPVNGNIRINPAPNTDEVVLAIVTGGHFDSADFDATTYNRGWVVLEYVC